MKRLTLKSPSFAYIEKSFGEWLDILGYADFTVYSQPNYIRELLYHLEQQGKTQIKDITKEQIRAYYYHHLRNRSNKTKGGALSPGHLNKHLQALYKFTDYLRQSGRQEIPTLAIRMEPDDREKINPLTEEEIKQLYEACEHYGHKNPYKSDNFYPAIALRDKAMLALYYGCGLRRNEGVHVELSDILWDKRILHVSKGKNYKERFVPISPSGLKHFENYLYDARPMFTRDNKEERFLVSERGRPIEGQSLSLRLRQLVMRTENETLINKQPGLHTLRHSIATHLLAKGMKLEKIKDFLGHSSLESTQIYTHLIENENGEYDYSRTGNILQS